MNLAELLASIPEAETLRGLALILTSELVATLEQAQSALGPRMFEARPLALSDGTYMLGADLLSEIGPDGLYATGFSQLPPETFPLVSVVPIADAVALMPTPEDE